MINGKDQEIITINKTGNSILNNAKYSADNTDEWYTTYETIAEELSHYKNQFIDKVVLCNCDDPFESNFCYYFLRHFNQLKLKKLICTSYSGSKIDQLVNGQLTLDLLDADGNPVINNKHGYVLTITQIPGEHEEEVPDNVIKNVLQKKNVVRKLSGNNFDGLINNTPQTPTVADFEQRAKAGEAISVTDLAKAVKAEKREQPQKKPSILKKLDEYKKQAAQQPKDKQKEHKKDLEV